MGDPVGRTEPDGASPEEAMMVAVLVGVGAGAVLLCSCLLVLKRRRDGRG